MKKKLSFFNEEGVVQTRCEYTNYIELMELAKKAIDTDGIILDCLAVCYKQKFVKDFIYQLDQLCFILSCVGGFQNEEVENLVMDELKDIFFEELFETAKYFETHKKLILIIKEFGHSVF